MRVSQPHQHPVMAMKMMNKDPYHHVFGAAKENDSISDSTASSNEYDHNELSRVGEIMWKQIENRSDISLPAKKQLLIDSIMEYAKNRSQLSTPTAVAPTQSKPKQNKSVGRKQRSYTSVGATVAYYEQLRMLEQTWSTPVKNVRFMDNEIRVTTASKQRVLQMTLFEIIQTTIRDFSPFCVLAYWDRGSEDFLNIRSIQDFFCHKFGPVASLIPLFVPRVIPNEFSTNSNEKSITQYKLSSCVVCFKYKEHFVNLMAQSERCQIGDIMLCIYALNPEECLAFSELKLWATLSPSGYIKCAFVLA